MSKSFSDFHMTPAAQRVRLVELAKYHHDQAQADLALATFYRNELEAWDERYGGETVEGGLEQTEAGDGDEQGNPVARGQVDGSR